MIKYAPCIAAVLAGIATIAAIACKLGGTMPYGVAPRGMLVFAAVMLLFGINHSLCGQCLKKE